MPRFTQRSVPSGSFGSAVPTFRSSSRHLSSRCRILVSIAQALQHFPRVVLLAGASTLVAGVRSAGALAEEAGLGRHGWLNRRKCCPA
jgi:hypothetical protein